VLAGEQIRALMAMPGPNGLFHRAMADGPVRESSPRLTTQDNWARLVVEELGLSKSQVNELQNIPLTRLSGAAAKP